MQSSTLRSRRAPRHSRRGVLMLVVLSLLVLFMLIGTAFLMSSNQYRHAAKAGAKLNSLGTPPTKLLDRALMQVLCDTGNQNSVLRYHSLLRDLYGSEGFEGVIYTPATAPRAGSVNLNITAGQVSRFSGALASANRAEQLGPTQGQLVDIYVRELAFIADDNLTTGVDESNPTTGIKLPDARHILKVERGANGLPEMYNMPQTKGYFNGCVLTITSGAARGQSTRIVDYEEIPYTSNEPSPPVASGTPTAPFPQKPVTRMFRFRVMAFPRSDGTPLNIDQSTARRPELSDIAGQTFVVNGRAFNGAGAGFNELAKAGEPRLTAYERTGIGPNPLISEVALTPNSTGVLISDPANSGTDEVGVGYLGTPGTPSTWSSLNPTSILPINRSALWKYPTFAGPGDADESYDAPDFQNMFLALQTVTPRSRGRVVQGDPANPTTLEVDDSNVNGSSFLRLDLEDLPLPSYHRPDLINFWFHRLIQLSSGVNDDAVRAVLAPYGANAIRGDFDDPSIDIDVRDQIVAMKRKFTMRPLREDHPGFDGGNSASRSPNLAGVSPLLRNGNIAVPYWEAVGPWDVDNDNDGVPDSIWVDLGDPVAQAEDGTLYKPLYALLIVDLDSKLNVNAHGLVEDLRSPDLSTIPNPNFNPSSPPGPANPKRIAARNVANDLALANGIVTSNLLPAGSGYGPAEISLRPLFSPNLPGNTNVILDGSGRTYASLMGNPAYDDYARVLVGRPSLSDQISGVAREQESVWGRHGQVEIRGNITNPSATWTNNNSAATESLKVRPGVPYNGAIVPGTIDPTFADRLTMFKFFGHPVWPTDMHGDQMTPTVPKVATAYGSPPDLQGRYAIGLDYTGQPTDESASDAFYYGNSQSLLIDTPYELDLSDARRRGAPDASVAAAIKAAPLAAINDDAAFATADLERILRAHDADAGVLPDRLWSIVDAFDPLKLFNNQPALVNVQAANSFGSTGDAERLAAAQQLAGINRRLVTTDSYDLPVAGTSMLGRLTYGADGLPGVGGVDDDGANGVDDPGELGWYNSDDWYAVMYHLPAALPNANFNNSGAPLPPAGVRLAPASPTIVELLRYRIQFERRKQGVPLFTEAQLANAAEDLLPREILAGGKMDLNRPFGDGRDSGDGEDNNGDGRIDEPSEPGDPYVNGIVDDPIEAGEPFLDANGNGKWDTGEKWIDVDADEVYDRPIDKLWNGLTSEQITFDYTNGKGVAIHPNAATGGIPVSATVRNLDAQGRQLYARQLYCMMLLLMDENYLEMADIPGKKVGEEFGGSNLNLHWFTEQLKKDYSLSTNDARILARKKLTAQKVAQWAVNCVDFRDADAIMTSFEYDENPWDGWGCLDSNGSNPQNIPLDGDAGTDENRGEIIQWSAANPNNAAQRKPVITVTSPPTVPNRTRGVVWGVEKPELLITETLAFHDRRCTDEMDTGAVPKNYSIFDTPAAPEEPDYDLDQKLKPRGSAFIELYNPSAIDAAQPRELYGTTAGAAGANGVMLNRLSDVADTLTGKRSPVWRVSILQDSIGGQIPVFRGKAAATGKLNPLLSGIAVMSAFGTPNDPEQWKSMEPEFIWNDPDGFQMDMDEQAERQIYFTTGGDTNRDNDNEEDLAYSSTTDPITKKRVALPDNPNLAVRVPPIRSSDDLSGATGRRYFIARNDRQFGTTAPDVAIAPILPGRYCVVGSSNLQLVGTTTGAIKPTPSGSITQRFVTPLSRQEIITSSGGVTGDISYQSNENHINDLARSRRIEMWPSDNPNVNQLLVAQNGGPEFLRIATNQVMNVTDPDLDGNPTTNPPAETLIDPVVTVPVEDFNISEPVEGYPSNHYKSLLSIPAGTNFDFDMVEFSQTGEYVYDKPYDTPFDLDFELVRNGTTPNYRSVHLQRLANPTLPWNPPKYGTQGQLNPMHRPELPVNPYKTIDSQGIDITAYNGATPFERSEIPTKNASKLTGPDPLFDWFQSNIMMPFSAARLVEAMPDHVLNGMIYLLELPPGTTPDAVRGAGAAAMESYLSDLKYDPAIVFERPTTGGVVAANTRATLESGFTSTVSGKQWKNELGWHFIKRVLPDDVLSNNEGKNGSFRQWLNLKSNERGSHSTTYFKYPMPGEFYKAYTATPTTAPEGWTQDSSYVPRSLWAQGRPNSRLFLQGTAPVDASDLSNSISQRVLSGGIATTTLTDAQISRNQLVWNRLDASTSGYKAVFDYVMEQTLGFANASYTPELHRADGQISATLMTSVRRGAPQVASQGSNLAPANPTPDNKELTAMPRPAAQLDGPNDTIPMPPLFASVTSAGGDTSKLTADFYARRELLTKSTYSWLTWNNRPFVGDKEILQVPASSSSLMLRNFSQPNLLTQNPYNGSKLDAGGNPKSSLEQLEFQSSPFGHLLNFFVSSSQPAVAPTNAADPSGAPNIVRFLDYVEVPSRYVGTDTLLSPEIFNDVPVTPVYPTEPVGSDITGPTDPRYNFQPPFNKVSRQRDPGKVNLNTVTGRRQVESGGFIRHWSEVYDGIMHRYGDSNLMNGATVLQLSHFGPAWRDVALSRRGYAQYNADGGAGPVEKIVDSQNQPDAYASGLNKDFPSLFTNPFRSADAGDLVPLANMVRTGVEATWLRGIHWQRAYEPAPNNDNVLIDHPFASKTAEYDRIAWGVADFDDDRNGIIDDIREAGYGVIANPPTVDGDTLRVRPSLNNALEGSGIPLFSEQVPVPAIDGERNPGMMYQPMSRLSNLVTTRSNVYAIWVTVGYFEVEKAPDWNTNENDVRARFGGTTNDGDVATIRARALYDRVYPDGYTLGEELGTDTGSTNRQRAFYIIDRTEPVGFKPGEDLNADKMIRVRRRIE